MLLSDSKHICCKILCHVVRNIRYFLYWPNRKAYKMTNSLLNFGCQVAKQKDGSCSATSSYGLHHAGDTLFGATAKLVHGSGTMDYVRLDILFAKDVSCTQSIFLCASFGSDKFEKSRVGESQNF